MHETIQKNLGTNGLTWKKSKNKIFANVSCSISPAIYRHMFALFHKTGIRG